MELDSPQREHYASEHLRAHEAQRAAEAIAFGPVVFQVARLMVEWGIFSLLEEHEEGLTLGEVASGKGLSRYAAQILLESALTAGMIHYRDGHYHLGKVGWFLQHGEMTRANLDFNHYVNYLGLYHLDEALQEGRPAGLKVFGEWDTIYEGLSQLPPRVQESWFGFDHFYSDGAFQAALRIVFAEPVRRLLDVGGNTGRWARQCVEYDPQVEVVVMDLPGQLAMMRDAVAGSPHAERIQGHSANVLDEGVAFPTGFDAIWMSQFLDCFSSDQVVSILSRARASMSESTRLYIMETLWDRQRFETASFCLAQTSVYFTTMANGNSKMFYSGDLLACIVQAGLDVVATHDGLGYGHSVLVCKLGA